MPGDAARALAMPPACGVVLLRVPMTRPDEVGQQLVLTELRVLKTIPMMVFSPTILPLQGGLGAKNAYAEPRQRRTMVGARPMARPLCGP